MPMFNIYQYIPRDLKARASAGYLGAPMTPPEPSRPPIREGSQELTPGLPAYQRAFAPPSAAARAVAGSGLPTNAINSLVAQGMTQATAIETLISALLSQRR